MHGRTKHSMVGLSRVRLVLGWIIELGLEKKKNMGREGSSRLHLLYGMQIVGIKGQQTQAI